MRQDFERPWPGFKELTIGNETYAVTGRTHPVDLGEHLQAAWHLQAEDGTRHVFYVGTDWSWALYRLGTVKSYPMSGGGTFLVAEGRFVLDDAETPSMHQARQPWVKRYFAKRTFGTRQ